MSNILAIKAINVISETLHIALVNFHVAYYDLIYATNNTRFHHTTTNKLQL